MFYIARMRWECTLFNHFLLLTTLFTLFLFATTAYLLLGLFVSFPFFFPSFFPLSQYINY